MYWNVIPILCLSNGHSGKDLSALSLSYMNECGKESESKDEDGVGMNNECSSPSITKMESYDETVQSSSWSKGTVDYSAANEYVQTHYGIENYLSKKGIVAEEIYNARDGVWSFDSSIPRRVRPSISTCGFELLERNLVCDNVRSVDWNDPNDVSKKYISQYLRKTVLPSLFDDILYCAFWNPTVRGENLNMNDRCAYTTKTAPVAATVHIDTDVGACSGAEELVNLLLSNKNRVSEENIEFDADQVAKYIKEGHRFILLNFWQNTSFEPVMRAPLGLMTTTYSSKNHSSPDAFPKELPDQRKSLWYCFPELTSKECMVFKQYDRDSSYLSDIWHCALSDIIQKLNARPRQNFDVRAFIVLNEKVRLDRFAQSRVKSLLNLEQSMFTLD